MKRFDFNAILLTIIGIVALAVIGCSELLDSITPCTLPPRSLAYVDTEPNSVLPTLNTAKNLRNEIIIKHRDTQIDYLRLSEDDTLAYRDAKGWIENEIAESQELQDLFIGSAEQPFSILGILGSGGIGLAVGKSFFKRKKDYTPEEYQSAVASATNNNNRNTV